jgi:hypothetical protein
LHFLGLAVEVELSFSGSDDIVGVVMGFGLKKGHSAATSSLGTERTLNGLNRYLGVVLSVSVVTGHDRPTRACIRPSAPKHRSNPTCVISSSGRTRPAIYAFSVGATNRLVSHESKDDTCFKASLSEQDLLRVDSASVRAGFRRTTPRREK